MEPVAPTFGARYTLGLYDAVLFSVEAQSTPF